MPPCYREICETLLLVKEGEFQRHRGGVFSYPVNHSNPLPLKREIFWFFGKCPWG
nr:MAG TPA: hypothetical protein [Caudoviricetes sp.]